MSAMCWQPIAWEDFGPGTADLAACEACGETWVLDEDGCCEIDSEVVACPHCGSVDTGPRFVVQEAWA